MKALAIWVVVFAVLFGAFALVTDRVREPDRVFVVVDSSFPMTRVWDRVPAELDAIDDQRVSEFALATEKSLVHSWGPRLRLGSTAPFAPCTFEGIGDHDEARQADERILITTRGSCDTATLAGWRIVLL